jgi:hypothetical protein
MPLKRTMPPKMMCALPSVISTEGRNLAETNAQAVAERFLATLEMTIN